jgi:hypothetical protein
MATSNAGSGSNRQARFTRSGAIQSLRSVRLSLPKVPAVTLSQPLRCAFGYHAVC